MPWAQMVSLVGWLYAGHVRHTPTSSLASSHQHGLQHV